MSLVGAHVARGDATRTKSGVRARRRCCSGDARRGPCARAGACGPRTRARFALPHASLGRTFGLMRRRLD